MECLDPNGPASMGSLLSGTSVVKWPLGKMNLDQSETIYRNDGDGKIVKWMVMMMGMVP